MASAEADPPHLIPHLPPEILRLVFSNLNRTSLDLVTLWLNCRLVSKPFKAEAEHIFATNFLSKTSLLISSRSSLSLSLSTNNNNEPVINEYQSNADTDTPTKHGASTAREKLSTSWWDDGLSYSGSFTFDRVSEEEGHRAVFRCDGPSDMYTANLFKALKDQELLQKVMMKPYHQMSLRQRVNYIPLPDLVVDVVDQTLELDWRQLFSRFFAQEKKNFVVGAV